MKTLYVRNIKKGFATNSSSYHSTLILSEEDYERWKNGEDVVENEDYYDEDDEKYISFEKYIEDYEWDVHKHETPSGEKIVVICTYGWGY